VERPAAAKAAGFDAVEFWWPFDEVVPGDSEVSAFEAAVRRAARAARRSTRWNVTEFEETAASREPAPAAVGLCY
jgi:hypothetical protein